MPTPIGHMLAGAAVGILMSSEKSVRRGAFVGALAGVAADFDFVPGIVIGAPGRFHHAATHSVTFALLAGLLAMLVAKNSRFHWAMLVSLAYASHLILDLVTFDDSAPHGIPVLWPLSTAYFQSPFTLFPSVPWGGPTLLTVYNITLGLRELGLTGLFFLGALLYARRRRVCQEESR